MVQAVEESVRREPLSSLQSSPDATPAPPPKTQVERKKVVIPIQDKDGVKQFHIYMAIESERQELELDLSSLGAVNKVFAAIFSKLEVPTKTTMSTTILEETTKWHGHCSSTFIGAAYNNKEE